MTTETDIPTAPARPDLAAILWRCAAPFFLFSAVLTVLLTLSWTALLPRYTRIEVGGAARSEREIVRYRQQLTAHISSQEEDRRQMVLAIHDARYDALKEERTSRIPLDEIRERLTQHAKAVTGKEDVIHWASFEYDPSAKTLVIRGDVRNVETRSMTVLAEFASSLPDLPFVASSTMPAFTREEEAHIGLHSPFAITLTLK